MRAAFTRCLCELPSKRGDVVGHLGILGTATASASSQTQHNDHNTITPHTAIIINFMFY